MEQRNRRRITIVLEPKTGLIPLSSFRTAIEQLAILLNEVAGEISEPKPRRISWGITELSLNSPATISISSTEEETEGLAERTVSVVVEGFTKLQKERVRPQYFNDNALECAQRLARLTDNLARINIYGNIPDQRVYLSEQIAVNITEILEYLDYHGSVDGVLELISGREGQPLYFRVRDRISNAVVRCDIPDELLDNALNAFRHRVIVAGIIKSDNNGKPRRIHVNTIETIRESKQLPQAEDIIKELQGQRFGIQPYEK